MKLNRQDWNRFVLVVMAATLSVVLSLGLFRGVSSIVSLLPASYWFVAYAVCLLTGFFYGAFVCMVVLPLFRKFYGELRSMEKKES